MSMSGPCNTRYQASAQGRLPTVHVVWFLCAGPREDRKEPLKGNTRCPLPTPQRLPNDRFKIPCSFQVESTSRKKVRFTCGERT